MSSTPTLPETSRHPDDLQPPEESVWKRYSPHNEAPLASAGSFALHALGIGAIVLVGFLASMFGFNKTKKSLPVEPVRLQKLGGGGGNPKGVGGGPGIGTPMDTEIVENPGGSGTTDPSPTEYTPPKLDPGAIAKLPPVVKANPAITRYIQKGHPNVANLADNVSKKAADKLRSGIRRGPVPGKGKGGTGSGGGQGMGMGTGTGNDEGPGKSATLTQREKRMLRWTMIFDTDPRLRGRDYLTKLSGLGAILGFPTRDGADYRIVRNLTPGRRARLLKEDLSKLERIYWKDFNPKNVRDIATQLGLPYVPNHFVAFMPKELEAKLFDLERAHRGLEEDQIYETKFKIRRGAGGWQPYVVQQTPK